MSPCLPPTTITLPIPYGCFNTRLDRTIRGRFEKSRSVHTDEDGLNTYLKYNTRHLSMYTYFSFERCQNFSSPPVSKIFTYHRYDQRRRRLVTQVPLSTERHILLIKDCTRRWQRYLYENVYCTHEIFDSSQYRGILLLVVPLDNNSNNTFYLHSRTDDGEKCSEHCIFINVVRQKSRLTQPTIFLC